jgi:choline/glycine/proline betaine transport protein
LIITASASIWPSDIDIFFKSIQHWLVAQTSWLYIFVMALVLFLSLWLMVSRMGDIKLGPDHSEPAYSNLSWFAMLFSAGMGIGLLFFGVAEPLMHFSSPPVGEAQSLDSAREALKITFFHWGLHGWALYALSGIILAYFCYRKNLPLLPRSALFPFIGKRIHGKIGDAVDTVAIICTMFGIATSLGLGVAQVNAGLNYLFDVPQTITIQIILIAVITLMATTSVVLGLDGGIKRLSNINMVLAVILLVTVIILGSGMDLLKAYLQNSGAYLSDIIYKTFNLYAYQKKETWIGGWTLLYWGWWISWAPFVGMFIARISRGRTIREFICGVLFVPAAFTFLWMSVFGNSAIDLVRNHNATNLIDAVNNNVPTTLFKFFEYFPASTFLSILGLILVISFFVSSSDSGSLVIDTLASGGLEEPPVWQRILWATLEGAVAASLLVAGGLEALQTMVITSAFPMIFIILISAAALIKSLRADHLLMKSVKIHTTSLQYSNGPNSSWRERIDALMDHPEKFDALDFLKDIAIPALNELKDVLVTKGLEVELRRQDENHYVEIVVKHLKVENFVYGIKMRSFVVPDYVVDEHEKYYRAEVFLISGGQNYDVYGHTSDQIISDAITQYEKHYHFLHTTNAECV